MIRPNLHCIGPLLTLTLAMGAAASAQSSRLPRPESQGHSEGYDQPFRLQVHFSPQRNWINDPNGLVFFHGEYHLFYQYNPFGDQWGHMSWGHAVSKDLLHWHELPVAIPERDGVMIFTGSIVVDHANTTGFCAAATECLVAIYTGHSDLPPQGVRQNQNLAFSRDDGRTWTAYQANPVLDLHLADFRDPSVSWDEQAHHWLMAVSLPKEHKVRFYASPDLKDWKQLSDFGPAGDVAGDWECPDLLHVPAADGRAPGMWALKVGLNPGAPQGGSGEQYFLGSFDGKTFQTSTAPGAHGWTNYGKDDYCAISYNGLPRTEQPVLLGWMSNWQYAAKLPTAPWRGQMSLPRRLSLVHDHAGIALRQQPIIAALQQSKHDLVLQAHAPHHTSGTPLRTAPFEVQLRFTDHSSRQPFGLRLRSDPQHWTDIGFDRQKAEFYIDRTHSGQAIAPDFPARTTAPLVPGRPIDLTLIVDRSSVEAFVQGGTIAMTDLIFAPSPNTTLELFSSPGQPISATGSTWNLDSIWK